MGLLGATVAGSTSLAAAALLGCVALVVLRANPSGAPNRFFAFFLLLVAGNGVADGLRKVFLLEVGTPEWLLLEHIGLAFLVLDPALLLYFASIYPRRTRAADHPLFAPGVVALWAFFAAVLVAAPEAYRASLGPSRATWAGIMLLAYLGGCYLAAYVLLLRQLRGEPSPRRLRQQQLLVGAFGIALVYRVGVLPSEFLPLGLASTVVASLIAVGLFASIGIWSLHRARNASERAALARAHRVTAAGIAVLAVLANAGVALHLLGQDPLLVGDVVEAGSSATSFFRWVLFALVGGYAILRYQLFDIDIRVHRATRVALAVGVVAVGVLAARALARSIAPPGELWGDLLFGAGAVLAMASAIRLSDLGARLLAPPTGQAAEFVRLRKMEVYGAALATALEEGQDVEGPSLQRLRASLGLSTADHRDLLAIAASEALAGPRALPGLRVGSVVAGRYRVVGVAGEGRQGRAHRALDLRSDAAVVLKELRPELNPDPRSRARVFREAEALCRIDHPNVMRLFEVVSVGGAPCLVLESLPGGSLRDLLQKDRCAPREAVRIASDILAGLGALHSKGTLHRDLKPENILFDADGNAKVGDLGVALVPAGETTLVTRDGGHPGTLAYMSPEQREGARLDERSDLYPVAVMLEEMLTGGIGAATPRGKESSAPGVPWTLLRVAAQGRANDPSRRFRSAEEFASALRRAASETLPAQGLLKL